MFRDKSLYGKQAMLGLRIEGWEMRGNVIYSKCNSTSMSFLPYFLYVYPFFLLPSFSPFSLHLLCAFLDKDRAKHVQ